MNIAIEGDVYIGVSEHLAQTLYLKSHFHATSSKRVSEGVKIGIRYATTFDIGFEAILHCARLNVSVISS